MRCPACKERVISFTAWSQGFNGFRKVDCPSCKVALQPGRRFFVAFFAMLLLLVPLAIGILIGFDALGIMESMGRALFGGLIIVITLGPCYWIWKTGYYTVRDTSKDMPEPIALEAEPRRILAPHLFVVAIGIGLIGLMVWLGHRDLLLTFDSQAVMATITRVHQPEPGWIRASDYEIRYEFRDEQGTFYSGEDDLPPAKEVPADGVIAIVYSRRDPQISRLASQASGTPFSGVVMGMGIFVTAIFGLVRERRQVANERPME